MTARTLTPKEIALDFGTNARTLRKFLRDAKSPFRPDWVENPGKGSRYAIEARRLKSLRKGFDAWIDAKVTVEEEVPETVDEVEVLDSEEVLEGTETE